MQALLKEESAKLVDLSAQCVDMQRRVRDLDEMIEEKQDTTCDVSCQRHDSVE